jgi:4-diphosphocytidyl-2-C-methyl-D-erythritol kinase
VRASAPAKVNLGLFLGPLRADGRHELASVMQSVSLADELTLEATGEPAGEDQLVCPRVAGPPSENIAWRALREFRASTGWGGPPVRLTIDKAIPVAGGLGGGSADAAAVLRMARHASGLGDERLLLALAAGLGADVPAQVRPGRWLAGGAGERLQELAGSDRSLALLVLPLHAELSTAAVYAEADRLGLARSAAELTERWRALRTAWTTPGQGGAPRRGGSFLAESELLHNDLQDAAVSLCAQIAPALQAVRAAGADRALVSGSGPTVVGLFAAGEGEHAGARGSSGAAERARRAAAALGEREPAALCALPVDEEFARAR